MMSIVSDKSIETRKDAELIAWHLSEGTEKNYEKFSLGS
jgi:hypothetical protein